MPPHYRKVYRLLTFLPLFLTGSVALDFSQCFADVTSCAQNSSDCTLGISNTTALSVLLTSQGQHVTSTDAATGLSLTDCTAYCGTGQEQFSWYYFAQGYAAWLLPYLALVSQLPFGAQRRMDNLMSAILTLGSPTLAGYSLYMTLLNARWVNDRLFAGIDYPSPAIRQSVVRVLSSLQQVPLHVHPGEPGRFESLIVHPDNDNWWTIFAEELNYSQGWSIASATSITWVIIAYLLNVGNTISINVSLNVVSPSEAAGSGLLGLLPIVVGWLVLSPKCDYDRVYNAYRKANKQVFAADSDDHVAVPTPVTANFGLTIQPSPDWLCDKDITSPDELRIPPVFNYARLFSWYRHVYLTSLFYRAAWRKSNNCVGVDGKSIAGNIENEVPRTSRLGTREQIISYCQPDNRDYSGTSVLWPPGLFTNMMVASVMSLLLQWGTTLASFLSFWFTPPIGMGCHSIAYLIYGMTSTVVWMLFVLSSVLSYYAQHILDERYTLDLERAKKYTPSTPASDISAGKSNCAIPLFETRIPDAYAETEDVLSKDTNTDSVARMGRTTLKHYHRMHPRTMSRVADWLRWAGKFLAIINAISVIANSIFQYAGFYSSCYCSSNAFSQGAFAYLVINPSSSDVDLARRAWIGGVGLSLACSSFFMVSIYLVRDSLPA